MSILASITRGRRQLYRYLKYQLLAPTAPRLEGELRGRDVVIVGSAPVSTRPAGWDGNFRVISINASQMAARAWLSETPDVTLMQFNQIEGTNANAREVRRVLAGQRTGILYVIHWRHGLARLQAGLAGFGYGCDSLRLMGRYERIALMRAATGRLNLELEADSKWSNGIVAAALAIHSGARNVILTGINPKSSGHGYNALDLKRLHADSDLEALRLFLARGYPLHTADPGVAAATGLPLWSPPA
ncbi:hypothetical protein [Paracoccus sp. (in: a-proteobacteria)]|uniref:hypothetical protein n=1 Tax=Paracoccus sp. TaxID=267 RepID=UPI00321F9A4C